MTIYVSNAKASEGVCLEGLVKKIDSFCRCRQKAIRIGFTKMVSIEGVHKKKEAIAGDIGTFLAMKNSCNVEITDESMIIIRQHF